MVGKKLKANNITKNRNNQKEISEIDKDLANEATIITNQKHRAQKILRGLYKIRAKRLQELSTLLREKLLAEEKQKKVAQRYHKKQVQMLYRIRLKRWLKMLKRQKRTLMRVRSEHIQTTQKLNALRRKMHSRYKRTKYARSYAKRMRELFESWRQVLKQLQLRRMQKELEDHQLRIKQRKKNLRSRVIEIDNDINKVKWYLNSLKKFEMSPKFKISKALIEKIKSKLKPTLQESTRKESLLNLNDLYLDYFIRQKARKIKQKKRKDAIEEEQKQITPIYRVKDKLSEKYEIGQLEVPIDDLEMKSRTRRYIKKGRRLRKKILSARELSLEMMRSNELEKAGKGKKSSSSLYIDEKISQELQNLKEMKKTAKKIKTSFPLYEDRESDSNKKLKMIRKRRRSSASVNLGKVIKSRRPLTTKKLKPVKSLKSLERIEKPQTATSDDNLDGRDTKVKFPNKTQTIHIKKSKSGEELYANQLKRKKHRLVQRQKEIQPKIDIMEAGDNENVFRTDSQIKLIEAQEKELLLQLAKKGSGSAKTSTDSRSSVERKDKMQLQRQRNDKMRKMEKGMKGSDGRRQSIDSRSSFEQRERIQLERQRILKNRKKASEMRGSDASIFSRKLSIGSRSSIGQRDRIKPVRQAAMVDSRGSIDSRNYAAYTDDIWNDMQKSHKEMIGDGATNAVKQKRRQRRKSEQLQEASKRYLKASKPYKSVLKPISDFDHSQRSLPKQSSEDHIITRSRLSFHDGSQTSRPSQGSIATIILDNSLKPRVSYFQDKPSVSVMPSIDAEDQYKTKTEYEDVKILFDIIIKRKVKLSASELSVLKRYTLDPKRYNKLLEQLFEDHFSEYQTIFNKDAVEPQFTMIKQRSEIPFPRHYSLASIKSEYSDFEEEPHSMPTTDWTQPEFTKAYWDSYLASREKTPFQIKLQNDRARKEKEELKTKKLARKEAKEKVPIKKKRSKIRLIQMLYSNPRKTVRERKIEEMYKNIEKPIVKCQSTCSDCCPCCNLPVSQVEQQKDKNSSELSSTCSQCGGFVIQSNSTLFKSLCSMSDIFNSESTHKQPIDIPEIPDIVNYQCKVLRSACDLLTSHSTNKSDDIRYSCSLLRLPPMSSYYT